MIFTSKCKPVEASPNLWTSQGTKRRYPVLLLHDSCNENLAGSLAKLLETLPGAMTGSSSAFKHLTSPRTLCGTAETCGDEHTYHVQHKMVRTKGLSSHGLKTLS